MTTRSITRILAGLAIVGGTIATARSQTLVYQSNRGSTAVDIHGIRHKTEEYPGNHAPWDFSDRVAAFGPPYPTYDRARRNQGAGFFRISIDSRTGAVTEVSSLKSTGFASLDAAAI